MPARFVVGICIIAWIGCSRREEPDRGVAPSAAAPLDAAVDAPLTAPRRGDVAQGQKLCLRAHELDEGGAAEAALAQADLALAADPACVPALLLRAQIKLRDGDLCDPIAALVAARRAALVAPDDPDVVVSEGFARHRNGDSARARALLEQWLALPPQPGRVKLRAAAEEALGCIALRHDQVDVAELHFKAAQQLDPGRATICYGLAMVCDARGDLAGEEHWLDESLARDPHALATRNARLALLLLEKKGVEAEREKRILALLRQIKDDASEALAQDHVRKAALWRELADALPPEARATAIEESERLLHRPPTPKADGK